MALTRSCSVYTVREKDVMYLRVTTPLLPNELSVTFCQVSFSRMACAIKSRTFWWYSAARFMTRGFVCCTSFVYMRSEFRMFVALM